jgi:hypothetical protein
MLTRLLAESSKLKTLLKLICVSLVSITLLVCVLLVLALRFPQVWFREEWAISLLRKQDFAKAWTWKELNVAVTSSAFLDYKITVTTLDLSASYVSGEDVYAIEDADLKLQARASYSFTQGLDILPLSPLSFHARELRLRFAGSTEPPSQEKIAKFHWKKLLRDLHEFSLPNLDVDVGRLSLESIENSVTTPLATFSKIHATYASPTLTLSSSVELGLADSKPLDLLVQWDTGQLVVSARSKNLSVLDEPSCKLSFGNLDALEAPSQVALRCQSSLRAPKALSKIRISALPLSLTLDARLEHDLSDPMLRQVRLDLSSPNPTWKLAAHFEHKEVSVEHLLKKPGRALEELLPAAHAELSIPKLKRFLNTFPAGYNQAPAPLSSMDGPLEFQFHSTLENKRLVSRLKFATALEGAKQEIKLRVEGLVPWDTSNIQNPKAGSLEIAVFIDKFLLMLPRVSVREPLPALLGDPRIHHAKNSTERTRKSPRKIPPWTVAIKTRDPVSFRTSLLKEEFKFLLDLVVGPDGPEKGSVELLPMKAEILRRPIEVQNFVTTWDNDSDPTLQGRIRFALPEYEIFLKIEGTLDSPRTAFESKPPLSTDDIYSVLLFGRPMSELDPEGRQGISRVQAGLAQGFFSLSTLYLLAGSRIESLGFDPSSNDVTAQLRLDKRHTLRLGTQEGQGTVALRRSLGGGWFIESSAQEPSQAGEQNTKFGLLLQRVIAY